MTQNNQDEHMLSEDERCSRHLSLTLVCFKTRGQEAWKCSVGAGIYLSSQKWALRNDWMWKAVPHCAAGMCALVCDLILFVGQVLNLQYLIKWDVYFSSDILLFKRKLKNWSVEWSGFPRPRDLCGRGDMIGLVCLLVSGIAQVLMEVSLG